MAIKSEDPASLDLEVVASLLLLHYPIVRWQEAVGPGWEPVNHPGCPECGEGWPCRTRLLIDKLISP